MKIMSFLFLMTIVFFLGCETPVIDSRDAPVVAPNVNQLKVKKYKRAFLPPHIGSSDSCCSNWGPNRQCFFELIPGCSQPKPGDSDQCCASWGVGGKCLSENIPGCSTPFGSRDNCCAQWGANGVCHHELIPGCSKTKKPYPQAPTPGSSDPCCASWGVGGKCLHELIPGCSNSTP